MTMFTSGTQAIQGRTVNHDPLPCIIDGRRWPESICGAAAQRDPRPEYAVLDNPILAAFRENLAIIEPLSGDWSNVDSLAKEWLEHFNYYWQGFRKGRIARVAHRSHARRVLEKLVAVYEIKEAK